MKRFKQKYNIKQPNEVDNMEEPTIIEEETEENPINNMLSGLGDSIKKAQGMENKIGDLVKQAKNIALWYLIFLLIQIGLLIWILLK